MIIFSFCFSIKLVFFVLSILLEYPNVSYYKDYSSFKIIQSSKHPRQLKPFFEKFRKVQYFPINFEILLGRPPTSSDFQSTLVPIMPQVLIQTSPSDFAIDAFSLIPSRSSSLPSSSGCPGKYLFRKSLFLHP